MCVAKACVMPVMGVCVFVCVCVCEASREGEQMPAGHVISLTLGQSQWQPSQWKQRGAGLQAAGLGAG